MKFYKCTGCNLPFYSVEEVTIHLNKVSNPEMHHITAWEEDGNVTSR